MKLYHMSGAGNDFMVIDARGLTLDFSQLSKTLCAQYGTDGFMALDVSEIGDFRLHFYNPDGSRGRCAATVPGASVSWLMIWVLPGKQ